jgi:uncharacterized membrane protein YebE (DUF533 family)
MDPSLLVDGVIRSVLGGRGKKSGKALRFLTGGRGGSFLSNPTTLLAAAGVAWGVYETLKGPTDQRSTGGPNQSGGFASPPVTAQPLPPLPNVATAPPAPPVSLDDEALRLVRLAISAARADGAMNDRERAAIVQQAAAAGVSAMVEQELQQVRPLSEIVAGVSERAQRATLYVLAFTILRADEQLSGAERIYLAQLAHLLALDRATVEQLEKDAGERIDALGDQGQPGG